jgi:hypothetical protein
MKNRVNRETLGSNCFGGTERRSKPSMLNQEYLSGRNGTYYNVKMLRLVDGGQGKHRIAPRLFLFDHA